MSRVSRIENQFYDKFLELAHEVANGAEIFADIAHNVEHIKHPHSAPEFHQEVHGTGRIYVKPCVDSPQDIAERAFDAGLNAGLNARDMGGHSR